MPTTAFWELRASERPAFLLQDGTTRSYADFASDVKDFRSRLGVGRGVLGLRCSGTYLQYVAYVAALSARWPVALISEAQGREDHGITFQHLYDPASDTLHTLTCPAKTSAIHPDLAVLLSTSGSTGAAKWVRLSHTNIASNAGSIAAYLHLSAEDRAPMALPFQYSYGMSVLNSHLAVGASLVLTEGSVRDANFWTCFSETGCTGFAGVPHTYDLMEQTGVSTAEFSRLRYMTQAGGRLPERQVLRWVERGAAEGWSFFVMYGQTEASPRIAYLPPEAAALSPMSIGRAISGGALWVAGAAGEILPDGQEGELIYRGPNVMMGYATRDADLALGQGPDVLSTGDIARQLPDGHFEIVGRSSRFVKLYGYRVGLDEVEKRLQAAGHDTACSAVGEMMHILAASAEGHPVDTQGIAADVARWLAIPESAFCVRAVDAIPRQENGKIDYQAVSRSLTAVAASPSGGGLAKSAGAAFTHLHTHLTRRPRTVRDVFDRTFPGVTVAPEMSFNSLGGDSLSFVSFSIDLEEVLKALPEHWEKLSIAELEALERDRTGFSMVDSLTLLRAVAIMSVVAGHFNLVGLGTGTFALFFVMGTTFGLLTLPRALDAGGPAPIWLLMARVGFLTVSYTALHFVVTGYGEWPAFLMLGNWISPFVEGSAWFVEVYLQVLLIIAAALTLSTVRSAIASNPFNVLALATALMIIVAAVSDQVIDTHHLFRRLPHILGWLILAGITAAFAQSTMERALTSLLVMCGVFQYSDYMLPQVNLFHVFVIIMIWLPAFPVPTILVKPIRHVAGASLFIYLTHFQFAQIVEALGITVPFVAWGFALIGGVIAWRLYVPVDNWVTNRVLRAAT